jgi:hypothetical protein
MTAILIGMCRICTKEEETQFILKLSELSKVTTTAVGLTKWFTLDETSEIRQHFKEQYGDLLSVGGDIGGSEIILPKNP